LKSLTSRPPALFFDLNSTLLDNSGGRQALVRTCETVAESRPGLDAVSLLEANQREWSSYWPEVEDKWNLGEVTSDAISFEVWCRALASCGFADQSLARLTTDLNWRNFGEAQRLYDDVFALLDSLPPDISLAIVSNGGADSLRQTLHGFAPILPRFDLVVISGEVRAAKPDPAILNFATKKLGVAPEAVWHIGDSLASDVVGAKAAGLTAVWLNRDARERKRGDPEPDFEIASLLELLPLLGHHGQT
jgi:putative hydrolase of the HAD superfamily